MWGFNTAVYKVRGLVSTGTPVIFTGNWDVEYQHGWRWECNLEVTDAAFDETKEIIIDAQLNHGKENVCVGHAMNEEEMKPMPESMWFGLYVRDTDQLVEKFQTQLDGPIDWMNK